MHCPSLRTLPIAFVAGGFTACAAANGPTTGLLRARLETPSSAAIEEATNACLQRTDWVVLSAGRESGGVRLISARTLGGSHGVGVSVNSKGQSGLVTRDSIETVDVDLRIYPRNAVAPRMSADVHPFPFGHVNPRYALDDFWTCLTWQLEAPPASETSRDDAETINIAD